MTGTPESPSDGHKPSNVLDVRTLVTVKLSSHHEGQALTLIARTSAGTYYEAGTWKWATEAMPAGILLDVLNSLSTQVTGAIVRTCGVQEVLEAMPRVN